MLNQQQIAAARKQLNITPQAPAALDRSADFASAMGTAPAAPAAPVSTAAPQANPVEETGSNYMKNVAPAANDLMGGGNIGSAVDKLGKGDIAGGVEDATLGTASDAVQAIFAPIAAPIQTLLSHMSSAQESDAAAGGHDALLDSPILTGARKAIESWGQQNPQLMKTLSDVFNVGAAATGSGALDTTVSDAATGLKNSLTDTAGKVKDMVTPEAPPAGAPDTTPAAAGPDLTKINDMIAPKPTVKAVRTAQQEGRYFAPGEPGLLKEGTPGKIAASPSQASSAQTIGRLIPDADKMDAPTLYGATQAKVTELATDLKPKMEKTPIPQSTIDKVNADTKTLFAQQKADALASDEPNVAKLQKGFQAFLKKSATGNFNDLWETAKNYDMSVPDKVKSASDASSHELQMQQEVWLQNRAVLKAAINDTVDGMGKTSQKAFKDMRDLFNAQHDMDTTAKMEPAKPSKFDQAISKIKKHPVLIGAGAYETAKHTIAPALPGI